MTDNKIDVKHLTVLGDAIDHLIEHLEDEKELMQDDDADMFNRYMAYHRLVTFMSTYNHLMERAVTSFRLGNDLQNPIFHTKEHKKRGWLNPSCNGNPFFESADDEEGETYNINHKVVAADELPEELQDALKGLFKLASKKRKK